MQNKKIKDLKKDIKTNFKLMDECEKTLKEIFKTEDVLKGGK